MEKSRSCNNCNTKVHRAPYAKHLRNQRHLENEKQIELNIQNGYLKNLLEKNLKNI